MKSLLYRVQVPAITRIYRRHHDPMTKTFNKVKQLLVDLIKIDPLLERFRVTRAC